MHRPTALTLTVALLASAVGVAAVGHPAPAEAALPDPAIDIPFDPSLLDPEPVIGGGVEGHTTPSVPGQNWRVHAFAQVGNRIFVGGSFTTVTERPWDGAPTHAQPYLAAFDLDTNNWISTFTPALDDAVWALAVHNGKLLVGGEFDTVNGVARQGLVALDPESGEIIESFVAYIDNAGSAYEPSVRALEVVGDQLYVVGDFNRLVQPPWAHGVYRLARVNANTGVFDKTWYPRISGGGVFDISVDVARNKAVLVGAFTSVNASASTLSGAAVNLTDGATIVDHPMSTNGDWDQTYGTAMTGDRYWLGGEQHYLQVRDADDWGYLGCFGGGNWSGPVCTSRVSTPPPTGSNTGGGDFQVVEEIDGYVVAGGHVQWHLWSSFDSAWTLMSQKAGTRIMAADGSQADFLANLTYWTEGPYAYLADTNGCLYIGGDYVGNVDGFGRMCPVLAPQDVSAVDGPAINVSWTAPAVDGSGVDHYEVSRDGTPVADVTSPSFVDTDVVEGQSYSYTVVAVTGSDTRGPASEAAVGTATAAGDPVIDPIAEQSDPIESFTSLAIVASDPDGGSVTFAADQLPTGLNLNANTGVISGTPTVVENLTVTITVTDDEGAFAEATFGWDVYDPDIGLPPFGTPADVVLSTNDVDTVTVEWEGVADAAGYLVHRDWQYQAFVTAGTTYVDTNGITPGQTYRYHIRAQDDQGTNSAPTPTALITVGGGGPDVTAPSIPANVAADTNGVDQVTLSWDPSTDDVGVTGYLIHRDWQYLAFVSAGTEFVDNSVVAGESYRYQVRAQDAAGNNSGPSDILRITVEAAGEPDVTAPSTPPNAVAAMNGLGDAVDVTWDPSTDDVGVTGYLIHRDWQYLAFVPAGTSYSDPSIVAGTRYRYQVRAQDAAGNNSAPTALLVVDVP